MCYYSALSCGCLGDWRSAQGRLIEEAVKLLQRQEGAPQRPEERLYVTGYGATENRAECLLSGGCALTRQRDFATGNDDDRRRRESPACLTQFVKTAPSAVGCAETSQRSSAVSKCLCDPK